MATVEAFDCKFAKVWRKFMQSTALFMHEGIELTVNGGVHMQGTGGLAAMSESLHGSRGSSCLNIEDALISTAGKLSPGVRIRLFVANKI